MKINKKKKVTKRKVHVHMWLDSYERCHSCGAYEAGCETCSAVAFFDAHGKLEGIENC